MSRFPFPLSFFGRCLFLLLVLASCNGREERRVQRSFYWWRTVFRPSAKETETLSALGVNRLYVRFFDVDWNAEKGMAEPLAKVVFQQPLPAGVSVTPVVFITQEPLQKLDTAGLKALAQNTDNLLRSISANNHLSLSTEVQFDCDWTAATKDKYFFLLQQLRQHPFLRHKTVSATIRLHQLKFLSQNGVPPVDKGLLMCYNMGNLRNAETKNSIIEESELKKYINNLDTYPLPLDVALPVFDWWVLFDGRQYKGLLREFDPGKTCRNESRLRLTTDTVINGYAFRTGQWLRHERSDAAAVERCARLVSRKLKAQQTTVILYHLDERHLSNYTLHELESFYNGLR